MGNQVDGNWSKRNEFTVGGTLTALASLATSRTSSRTTGHSPSPTPPIRTTLVYAGQHGEQPTRQGHTSRVRTARIPGQCGQAVWQVMQ